MATDLRDPMGDADVDDPERDDGVPEGSETLVHSIVEALRPLRARVPVAVGRALDGVTALSDRLIAQTGGHRVEADVEGWVAVWPSTRAAVSYCLLFQEALLSLDWPTTLLLRPEAGEVRAADGVLLFRGLRVRQGVHVGQARGPAIHQVARAAACAHGGQVILTEAAWRRMRGALATTPVLRDLGSHALEGVQGRVRLFQVLPLSLDRRELPPPRTRTVVRTNVPGRTRPFLGRVGDLAALAELDAFGVRVVTIIGSPGVGKSALARQHATLHGDGYRAAGGVWLARLRGGGVHDLLAAVGGAIQVPLVMGRTADDDIEQLGHALARLGRTLLLVDADELGDEIAAVVGQWLRAAPDLRVLGAMPRRLGLKGEVAYELAPLPRPEGEGARSADAARLLLGGVTEVAPQVELDTDVLVSLVDRVDGNPLALELVAGLFDRADAPSLERSLDETSGGPLRVLDLVWSHLTELERATLAVASVFDDGFALGALDAAIDPGLRASVPASVGSLVARGLIAPSTDARTPAVRTYDVHPRVRAWVRRHGVDVDVRSRISAYVLDMCEPWPELAWGPQGPEVVARLWLAQRHLVDVVRWGTEGEGDPGTVDRALRALMLLQPVFHAHGPNPAWLALLDRALEQVDRALGADPVLQVRILAARADVLRRMSRSRQAIADLERGQAIAERWADLEGAAICASSLALAQRDLGWPQLAAQTLERSRLTFAQCGSKRREAIAAGTLGVVWMELGQLAQAERMLQEAVGTLRSIDARHFEAMYLADLGLLYRRLGRPGQTRDVYREALRIHRELGDRRLEAVVLAHLGALDHHVSRLGDARRALEAARGLAQEVGDRRTEAACLVDLGRVGAEDAELGVARQALLTALAIHRALEDRRGEGSDTGLLGVIQYLAGQPDAARDSLFRAVQLLESAGATQDEALYAGWLAGVEAARGRLDEAEGAISRARERVARGEDALRAATVEVFAAVVARARGADPAAAQVALEAQDGRASMDAELRLALKVART